MVGAWGALPAFLPSRDEWTAKKKIQTPASQARHAPSGGWIDRSHPKAEVEAGTTHSETLSPLVRQHQLQLTLPPSPSPSPSLSPLLAPQSRDAIARLHALQGFVRRFAAGVEEASIWKVCQHDCGGETSAPHHCTTTTSLPPSLSLHRPLIRSWTTACDPSASPSTLTHPPNPTTPHLTVATRLRDSIPLHLGQPVVTSPLQSSTQDTDGWINRDDCNHPALKSGPPTSLTAALKKNSSSQHAIITNTTPSFFLVTPHENYPSAI